MTNNLNSIIIEGIVEKCEKVENATFMRLHMRRYFKDNCGEIHEEHTYVDVEAYGKLASSCSELLTEGAGIRVVGRIKSINYENYRIVVHAEHIEAKPVTVKKD